MHARQSPLISGSNDTLCRGLTENFHRFPPAIPGLAVENFPRPHLKTFSTVENGLHNLSVINPRVDCMTSEIKTTPTTSGQDRLVGDCGPSHDLTTSTLFRRVHRGDRHLPMVIEGRPLSGSHNAAGERIVIVEQRLPASTLEHILQHEAESPDSCQRRDLLSYRSCLGTWRVQPPA